MTWLEAFFYGAVQGITEYLPVSSSAHLILAPLFLGKSDPGLAFDVFLHSGTLAATVIYFRKDWLALASTLPLVGDWFHPRPGRPPWEVVNWRLVMAGTVPALIVGAALHKVVEESFRGPATMVWTLLLGGVVLVAVDYGCRRGRELKTIGMKDALIIGAVQCLALVPGVSRSGSTMTAGRALGFSRESAARFSFLLSAPVTAAALLFELRKWRQLLEPGIGVECLLMGAVSSFVFGWLAIDVLLKVVRRYSYVSFAVYRAALAGAIWWAYLR